MKEEHKQITKLTIENFKLKDRIKQLELQLTFGTPTDGYEVGSPSDYEINPQLNLFRE